MARNKDGKKVYDLRPLVLHVSGGVHATLALLSCGR